MFSPFSLSLLHCTFPCFFFFFFFFYDPTSTHFYTLSLHDALPISVRHGQGTLVVDPTGTGGGAGISVLDRQRGNRDRKSTRLNSSHRCISYAVFCLKKKKQD